MAGMNWVKWPIQINFNPGGLDIDGVHVNYMSLAEIVNAIIHPDPRKWYRLERNGDIVTVHVKVAEEEPNGSEIASVGHTPESEKDAGGQGQ